MDSTRGEFSSCRYGYTRTLTDYERAVLGIVQGAGPLGLTASRASIAKAVGCSMSTVIRIMRKFERAGLIEIHTNYLVSSMQSSNTYVATRRGAEIFAALC